MPDYNKSIIYKIYDNTNGDTYYGSTCNELRFRIKSHKSNARAESTARPCKSKSIILNDDWIYSVVEKFPCETKHELHTRERYWIENNNCVNKQIPTKTQKEYDDERYANNKEEEQKRARDYYNNHKEEQSARSKQYGAENRAWIQEKRAVLVQCDCGMMVQKYYLPKHKTTTNHINLMNPPPPPPTIIICECGLEIARIRKSKHIKTAKHAKLLALICPPCNDTPLSHPEK